jgi:hypothetical protein
MSLDARKPLSLLEGVSRKEKARRLAKKKAREHSIPPEDAACEVVLPDDGSTVGAGGDETEILKAAARALRSLGTVTTKKGHHFVDQLHHRHPERGALKPPLSTAEVVRFFSRLPRARWFSKLSGRLRSMKSGESRSIILYDLSSKIKVPMLFTRKPSPDPGSNIALNTIVRTKDAKIGKGKDEKIYPFCTSESLQRKSLGILSQG